MKALEKIKALKDKFLDAVTPQAAPVATAPVVTPAPAPQQHQAVSYTLDNGTEVTINQLGEVAAVGDSVTVAGAPLPAGTYTLADKTSFTVDAQGIITEWTVAPVTNELNQPPAAVPVVVAPISAAKLPKNAEEFKAIFEKFASGSPEDRLTNLEIVAKALMEYTFGWQIKEQEERLARENAILVYKEGLTTATKELEAAKLQLETQKTTITELFALVEEIAGTPTADPITISDNKKEKFEKLAKRDDRLARFGKFRETAKVVS